MFAEAAEKGVLSMQGWTEGNTLIVIGAASISVLLLVFILSLCGGCTPMEVGSDQHEATGGRKYDHKYGTVSSNVNDQVMSAGTTLANDPYTPNEQALPYALHPQTAHTFTGYQSQDHNQGYQAAGSGAPAGAHRHFSESEPPPPAYSEAINPGGQQGQGQRQYGGQPSAPAQSYGW